MIPIRHKKRIKGSEGVSVYLSQSIFWFVLAVFFCMEFTVIDVFGQTETVTLYVAMVDSEANDADPSEVWAEPHSAGEITIKFGDETIPETYGQPVSADMLSLSVASDYKFHGWYLEDGDDWARVSSHRIFQPTESGTYQVRFSRASELVYIEQPDDSYLATSEDGHDDVQAGEKGFGIGNPIDDGDRVGVIVQLLYEDGTPVTNPGSEVLIDIAKEKGTPGAVLSAEGKMPGTVRVSGSTKEWHHEGAVHWPDLRIDRLGVDYKLSVRYRMQRGPRENPFHYWVPDGAHFEEDADGLLSDSFNIIASEGTVLAWGYDAFGQLGVNRLGMPGYYAEPLDPPQWVDTSWPHMHRSFWPGYLTDEGEDKLESEEVGWDWPGTVRNWWNRHWNYPTSTSHRQGLDRYEPVQPHRQFDDDFGRAFPYPDKYQAHQLSMQFVAAGHKHSLVLRADGRVFGWGMNEYGQVGVGSTEKSVDTMQMIGEIEEAVYVAAGEYHSLAVLQDGTVQAWGRNDRGQLGVGSVSEEPIPSPVQVVDPSDPTGYLQRVVAVEAGKRHNYALKSDGSVWAWGKNADGQLGDGTGDHSPVPVPVSGINIARLVGHNNDVLAIAYNSDGKKLATASADRTVRIWNCEPDADAFGTRLTLLGDQEHVLNSTVSAVAFSPCDDYIVTGGADSALKLWNAETGDYLKDLWADTGGFADTEEHQGAITALKTFADGDDWFVVSGSIDRTVRVWRIEEEENAGVKEELRKWEIDGDLHDRAVMALDITDDGNYILVGSAGGRGASGGQNNALASLWQWDGGEYTLAREIGQQHDAPVYAVAIDPQEDYLLTGSFDRTVRLWEMDSGNHVLEFGDSAPGHEHSLAVVAVDFCRFGDHVLTGSADALAKLWELDRSDVNNPDLLHVKTIDVHGDWVTAVAFSPDPDVDDVDRDSYGTDGARMHMATASRDGTAWLHRTPAVEWIAAGGDHGFAVLEDNTPLAWGLNSRGQLGLGDTEDHNQPKFMSKLDDKLQALGQQVIALDGGNTHSVALTDQGTVLTWGSNSHGQLGRDSLSEYETDVEEINKDNLDDDVDDVIAVAAGGEYTIVRSGEALWGFGNNVHGQLGINHEGLDGDNAPQKKPYRLAHPAEDSVDYVMDVWQKYPWHQEFLARGSVSAGHYHTLAVARPRTAKLNIQIDHEDIDASDLPLGLVTVDYGEPGEWKSFHSGFRGRINVGSESGILREVNAEKGTQVQLRAVSLPGFEFTHWSGPFDAEESFDPQKTVQTWHARRDITATAHFQSRNRQYELTVLRSPDNAGLVTGAGSYEEGEEVEIEATPFEDYEFLYWTGDDEIEGSRSREEIVRMTRDKIIIAVFEGPPEPVSLNPEEPLSVAPELVHQKEIPADVDSVKRVIKDDDGEVILSSESDSVSAAFTVPLGVLEHGTNYSYTFSYEISGETLEYPYVFSTGSEGECDYQDYLISDNSTISIAEGYDGTVDIAYKMPWQCSESGQEGDAYIFRISGLPAVGGETKVQFRLDGVVDLCKFNPITDKFVDIAEDDMEETFTSSGADDSIVSYITVDFEDGGNKDITGYPNRRIVDPMIITPAPDADFGELTVNLTPSQAVDHDAAWKVVEQHEGRDIFGRVPTDWLQSGESVTLNEGVYELEFRDLDDDLAVISETPANVTVELEGGETTSLSVSYTEAYEHISPDEALSVGPQLTHSPDVPSGVETMEWEIKDVDGNVAFRSRGLDVSGSLDLPPGLLDHGKKYYYTVSYEHEGETVRHSYKFETMVFENCEYEDDSILLEDIITPLDGYDGVITAAYKMSYPDEETGEQRDAYLFQLQLPSEGVDTKVQFRLVGVVELHKYNPVTGDYFALSDEDIYEKSYSVGPEGDFVSHFTVNFKDGGHKDLTGLANSRISDPMIVVPIHETEFGELTVDIQPPEIRDHGAAWRVIAQDEGVDIFRKVPTDWLESGETFELNEGVYEMEFHALDDQVPVPVIVPENRTETVVGGAHTKVSVDYSRDTTGGDDSSSTDVCFVATAAYGTPFAEEIDVLRSFRDRALLDNDAGKEAVELYYSISPPVADLLIHHPTAKSVVRQALKPVVALSENWINTGEK